MSSNVSSNVYYIDILRTIYQSEDHSSYCKELAVKLNKSESTINYHLRILLKKRLIRKGVRTSIQEYILTKKGFEKIRENNARGFPLPTRDKHLNFQCRLHGGIYKIPVLKWDDNLLKRDKRINLGTWFPIQERVGNLELKIYPETNTIYFNVDIFGTDQDDCMRKLGKIESIVTDYLSKKYHNLLLGEGKLDSKVHFSFPDYLKPDIVDKIKDNVDIPLGEVLLCSDESQNEITGEKYYMKKDMELKGEKEKVIETARDIFNGYRFTGHNFPKRIIDIERRLESLVSISEKLTLVTTNLQTSLQKIVTPFMGESGFEPANLKQKSLNDYIKEDKDISYIG